MSGLEFFPKKALAVMPVNHITSNYEVSGGSKKP